jgi:hypothetical protein
MRGIFSVHEFLSRDLVLWILKDAQIVGGNQNHVVLKYIWIILVLRTPNIELE